MAHLPC